MASQSPPADLALQVETLLASLPGTLSPLERGLPSDVAGRVDHTLLAPSATSREIIAATLEAVELGAKTVCVPSGHVRLAHDTLAGVPAERQQAGVTSARPLPICTVGFPHGNASSYSKAQETKKAVEDGAAEIDMVQNVGLVKEGRWDDLWFDVRAVVDAAKGSKVKVILESATLTREEIAASSLVACLAGAHFVKTSTGFSASGGATADAVRLMHYVASPYNVSVKASGGVRTWPDLVKMWSNGADRFGLSGTRAVLDGMRKSEAAGSIAEAGDAASGGGGGGGY